MTSVLSLAKYLTFQYHRPGLQARFRPGLLGNGYTFYETSLNFPFEF